MKKLADILRDGFTYPIPISARPDFGAEIARQNCSNARVLALCLSIYSLIVVAASTVTGGGGGGLSRNYTMFILLYSGVLIVSVTMFALLTALQRDSVRSSSFVSRTAYVFMWFFMFSSAAFTLLDLTFFPSSMLYVVSIVAVAVAAVIGASGLLLYAAVHIPYCVLYATFVRADNVLSVIVETTCIVVVCMLISHYMHRNRVRVFLYKLDMERANLELMRINAELESQVVTDSLTGVSNRRRFNDVLDAEFKRCERHSLYLSIIMIDIDHFKRYNDIYGHPAGDECLRSVARTVNSCLRRSSDFAARYGGEEFVVILPHIDSSRSQLLAERIRKAVEDTAIPHEGSLVSSVVTVSIGVYSGIPIRGAAPEDFVRKADKALYKAKRISRNTVVYYNEQDNEQK